MGISKKLFHKDETAFFLSIFYYLRAKFKITFNEKIKRFAQIL